MARGGVTINVKKSAPACVCVRASVDIFKIVDLLT